MAISTALAVLLCGGAPAMAASALTDTLNAVAAQYGFGTTPPLLGNNTAANPPAGPAPAGTTGPAPAGTAGPAPAGGNVPGNDTTANPPADAGVAPAAQAGAAGSPGSPKLPFTGYAAVPVLLIGLAFLVGGLLLRRGPRRLQQT